MAVKVMIPTPLRQFTGKQASIECNAKTVGEALGSLTGTFSELRKHLFTDDGRIRSFVNVYLNDEDIRFLEKENTRTKDGDTISIVPSIAGGCRQGEEDRDRARDGEEFRGESPWQSRLIRYHSKK
jgi:molybdopterin converting factor small subunit